MNKPAWKIWWTSENKVNSCDCLSDKPAHSAFDPFQVIEFAAYAKALQEIDKITNGIPSEWAYAILKADHLKVVSKLEIAEAKWQAYESAIEMIKAKTCIEYAVHHVAVEVLERWKVKD